MLQKKIWIPVLLVLIGFAIGGTFVGRHIASQEPVTIITPVTPEPVDRSQPTQAETQPAAAEGGHWHGDEWHADAHDTSDVIPEPMIDTPEFLSAERLLDLPMDTLSDVLVKSYVDEHFEEYPDCQEHEAVLEDAKRDAEWYLADREHRGIREALSAEWKAAAGKNDVIMPRDPHALEQFVENLTDAEKASLAVKVRANMEEADAAFKRLQEHDQQAPVAPKRMHTH